MKIIYSDHLIARLKLRNFPEEYPEQILLFSDKRFKDTITYHAIAIKTLPHAGKNRLLVIAYTKMKNNVRIITIHPISETQVQNRVRSKRWIPFLP